MKIKKIEFKNINSYGNNIQKIEFNDESGLILLFGENGAGKCLSPDTEIDIEINEHETYKKLIRFLKNRK